MNERSLFIANAAAWVEGGLGSRIIACNDHLIGDFYALFGKAADKSYRHMVAGADNGFGHRNFAACNRIGKLFTAAVPEIPVENIVFVKF